MDRNILCVIDACIIVGSEDKLFHDVLLRLKDSASRTDPNVMYIRWRSMSEILGTYLDDSKEIPKEKKIEIGEIFAGKLNYEDYLL